jgi:transposase
MKLVQSSRPNHIRGLDAPEVKRRLGVARRMADKWRERVIQLEGSNASQKSPGANHEKSIFKRDIFAEVVRRLDARWTQLERKVSQSGVVRSVKEAIHEVGAKAKSGLDEARSKVGRSEPKTPVAEQKSKVPDVGVSPVGPKTRSKKAPASRSSEPAQPIKAEQHRARTRISDSRLTQSGLKSRIRGHASSSGRKNQARRNKR